MLVSLWEPYCGNLRKFGQDIRDNYNENIVSPKTHNREFINDKKNYLFSIYSRFLGILSNNKSLSKTDKLETISDSK